MMLLVSLSAFPSVSHYCFLSFLLIFVTFCPCLSHLCVDDFCLFLHVVSLFSFSVPRSKTVVSSVASALSCPVCVHVFVFVCACVSACVWWHFRARCDKWQAKRKHLFPVVSLISLCAKPWHQLVLKTTHTCMHISVHVKMHAHSHSCNPTQCRPIISGHELDG